jgi:hypothetical protein
MDIGRIGNRARTGFLLPYKASGAVRHRTVPVVDELMPVTRAFATIGAIALVSPVSLVGDGG